MPIIFSSEESQSLLVSTYNKGKKNAQQIPLVPRNAATGWPLLQISLLTKNLADKYDHVLGGGNCHFFYIAAFSLANLITKIPGKIEVKNSAHEDMLPTQANFNNIETFLDGFKVKHQQLGITIESTHAAYGKMLELNINNLESGQPFELEQLSNDLDGMPLLKLAFRPKAAELNYLRFPVRPDYQTSPGVSEATIQAAINNDIAIFENGQIFIDFGAMLQRYPDPGLFDHFKQVFKVEEYLQLNVAHHIDASADIDAPAADEYKEANQSTINKDNLQLNMAPETLAARQRFNDQLITIRAKADDLSDAGHLVASEHALTLFTTLNTNAIAYFRNEIRTEDFRDICTSAMKTAHQELDKHRGWKEILGNLALALVTLGIGYLILGAVNQALTGHFLLFRPKTESQQILNDMEVTLNQIAPTA